MSKNVVGYYLLGIVAGVLGIVALGRVAWHGRFYPNVMIGQVVVGGMTREEARQTLQTKLNEMELVLRYNGNDWIMPSGIVEVVIDESLNQAYRVGRRLNFADYGLLFINKPQVYPLALAEGTTEEYEKLVKELSQNIEIPAVNASIEVVKGKVRVTQGNDGVNIDGALLRERIKQEVAEVSAKAIIEVPTINIETFLSEKEEQNLLDVAEKLLPKKLELLLDDEKLVLGGERLLAYLNTNPKREGEINEELVSEYVEGLTESYNSVPVDAKFEFVDGRVTEFAPGKDGVEVLVEETTKLIVDVIGELINTEEVKKSIEIVVKRTSPSVTMDKINEYGIKERVGRGESYYAGSIANRIYNIGLAASRTNSALIPPGEEYSFNKAVGEINGAAGYKTAYVIKNGRTELDDGGGVCQVSTTVFRAALSAGLPITERWAHAYRVGYYEQNSKPGVDATIYSPSKDLRFLNDTPGHILVQTINNPKSQHLVVEIYGTDDGRVASISEPKVWGITGPLPTVYQDDPSLPAGTVKQVDWAASGAKASFDYRVERNGEVLQEKTFSSSYRPWASVFLRGTGSSFAL